MKNKKNTKLVGDINKTRGEGIKKKTSGKLKKRRKKRKEETSIGVYATHPPGDLPLPLSLIPFFLCISVMLGLFATTP